ncbi:hypothetical protein D3C86_1353230 [compost metagenome]
MGNRPRFTFDPPDQIYAMKHAEVARAIEADLFTHQQSVIEAFEQAFPDQDAQMLAFIAGKAERPEKILELAASGILGPECRYQIAKAIALISKHQALNYVRGYWPSWSPE